MSERKRYHKDNAPTDDIITLINLVRQNPALYNYKLQPNQRRRPDILSGWQEVSQQMGNKYSVQEVRRKWKNLRDTYHQYRRRSPKCIEGRLSKWRYAKQLDFLSKVYQPKLKAHRNALAAMLQIKKQPQEDDDDVDGDGDGVTYEHEHDHDEHDDHVDEDEEHSDTTALSSSHHASSQITLVSDEAETLILTAYEESVADDAVHHHHHHHAHAHQQQQQQHQQQQQQHHHHHPQQHLQQQHHHHHHHHQAQHDGSISSIELSQITQDDDDDVVDDELDEDEDVGNHVVGQVVDIVKHELDEDGATGAEVHYEEVCFYEEASGAHCEMGVDTNSDDVADTKGFHYIDADGFCIEDIEAEPETEAEPELVPQPQRATLQTVSLRHMPATNSALAGVLSSDVKLKNLTLISSSSSGNNVHSGSNIASNNNSVVHSGNSLVDVTEATSTSVTIPSTLHATNVANSMPPTLTASPAAQAAAAAAAAAVAAAAAGGAVTMCNNSTNTTHNTFNTSTGTSTTILQLPPLAASSSISVASSSTLLKEDELQHLAQAQTARDELDLFFDFLKKKIQYFSKTQITHIQMEFLNCVSRQEVAEQDAKD